MNNMPYTKLFHSAEQFDTETFEISKHLKNTKVNVLRTAIANRFGYKSIQAYKKSFPEHTKENHSGSEPLNSDFDSNIGIKEDFGLLVFTGRVGNHDKDNFKKSAVYHDLFGDQILPFTDSLFDGVEIIEIEGKKYGRALVKRSSMAGRGKRIIIGKAIFEFCMIYKDEFCGFRLLLGLINTFMPELEEPQSGTRKVLRSIHKKIKDDPSLFSDLVRSEELQNEIIDSFEEQYAEEGNFPIMGLAIPSKPLYSDSEKLEVGNKLIKTGFLEDADNMLSYFEGFVIEELFLKRLSGSFYCILNVLAVKMDFLECDTANINWETVFDTLSDRETLEEIMTAFFGREYTDAGQAL